MPHLRCNNANLFYNESGSGTQCIVFSHGLMFNYQMWNAQVSYFETNYRCIAYDHRGQGQSEMTGSRDMDTLYDDAASLIEQLSPGKPVHFVGLSMGGFVGMRLAARKPYLLKSLTLMETSADPEVNKFRYILLTWIFKLLGTRAVSKKLIRILFGKSSLEDPAKKELLNYWKSQIESYPASIALAAGGVIHRQGIYHEIAKITLPTQVLVGEEDVATVPEKSVRIHGQISNSTLTFIPKAGHSSCIEQPETVNQLIEDFIQKISSK
jgi:3-oxoadipate enol-lactonase